MPTSSQIFLRCANQNKFKCDNFAKNIQKHLCVLLVDAAD